MNYTRPQNESYRNLSKHDELLIRLTLEAQEEKPKPKERPKIYIPINWKYIGMTKKERDEINE